MQESFDNEKKKRFKKLKHLFWALPALQLVVVFIFFTIAASSAVVVGKTLYDLQGVEKDSLSFLEDKDFLSDKEAKEVENQVGDDIRAALDCSNFSPQIASPGVNCLPGLIEYGEAKSWSPIPEDKLWLVPIWQNAARKYNLDWKLLAALSGARNQFGENNCSTSYGNGFYRHDFKNIEDRGETSITRTSSACYEVEDKVKIYKEKDFQKGVPGSVYDPVDSTFALARLLNKENAKKNWGYSGSASDSCTAPNSDGPVYLPPTPPSFLGIGTLGYNKNLEIPRALVKEASKWRSNKGELKPRRADDPSAGSRAMPKETLLKMLVAAWIAFGKTPKMAEEYANLNYQQIMLESGGRPYIMQGHIGDVNDDNPAGGLFQFIPETFDTWAVSGFEDRFNPIDNILAAVNAQVNSEMGYVLSGASGWSPAGGSNPYTTGGKNIKITNDTGYEKIKIEPYSGKPQTDVTSLAIQEDNTYSECYTAIVNDWYKLIEKYPPSPSESYMNLNFNGTKWIKGGKLVPCPKQIPHDTSNACYVDSRIVPNLLEIHKKYKIYISDGYSGPLPNGGSAGCGCHAIDGEHPLGVAVDINPANGDWSTIDKLALWAEPTQDNPKPPFRWVGYNGDAAHGTGHHLHLSWDHSPAPPYSLPKEVLVFGNGTNSKKEDKKEKNAPKKEKTKDNKKGKKKS